MTNPPPKWIIEGKEFGVWETLDEADSLEDAVTLASVQCSNLPEDRIRISTPDNEIL
jgi:hypothetical protein